MKLKPELEPNHEAHVSERSYKKVDGANDLKMVREVWCGGTTPDTLVFYLPEEDRLAVSIYNDGHPDSEQPARKPDATEHFHLSAGEKQISGDAISMFALRAVIKYELENLKSP